MEVTVLDATHPPPKPVLAVHAGSVRRQAKLEVNSPFVIPHPGTTSCTVEVSLFQQLASQTMSDDGKAEAVCSIPVLKPDGSASQVKLRVRRGPGLATSENTKPNAKDDIGMTRDYLDHHQLQHRIQSLIQDVLREQPADPYKYMLDQLKRSQNAASQAPQATILQPAPPSAPRPPDAPKPASSGRSYKPAAQNKASEGTRVQTQEPPLAPAINVSRTESVKKADEATKIARASLGLVLRSPACLGVAKDSLRDEEQRSVARRIWESIGASTMQKVVQLAVIGVDIKTQAQASIQLALVGACRLMSVEYKQTLTQLTCQMAFRGSISQISKKDGWQQTLIDPSELPVPIVSLTGESANWGAMSSGRRISR